MTLLFPNAQDRGKVIEVPCPCCNATLQTPYAEKKRTAEVCGRCNRLFHVQIFRSGTIIVE
ncbi:MAG: hypothetical protein KKE73_14310 [Proteobacteria bacterium]|nr:hypothetical protein [Pseudomonadota bacterium]